MTNTKTGVTRFNTAIIQLGLILLVLWFVSLKNYLFFHTLVEVITIVVALAIFLVTWNSRRFLENRYYLWIGIAFLFIGIINLMHAFAYKGLGILHDGKNANMATQLWLTGQYMTALTFLAAPFWIKRKLNYRVAFVFFAVVTVFSLLAIFYWKTFPTAFIDGQGLTAFKKISEFVISALFLGGLVMLHKRKDNFDPRAFRLLVIIILTMVVSELMFTLYVGVYDFFNMFGHLLRFTAFYLAYLAFVELGLMKPYRLIFKELKDSQKELEFEKNKLNTILDTMNDGVYMTNEKYEMEYCNPALIREFGPVNGSKCYQYLHERESPCPWCKNKEIFKGKAFKWEWRFEKNKKTYDLTDTPIRTADGIKSKLEISHDITERKEMEKAKDEFVSLASHQLRTPLASISLSSELLLRGTLGEVPREQREYLDEIYRSTKRMSVMVNNLLNVSRIEMGNFSINPEPLDVTMTVNSIINEFKPLADDKNITLEKNIGENAPIFEFDRSVLRIMVENLVSNAIRYTPRGGHVSINVTSGNDQVVIAVDDSGCGIPDDQKDQVFTKSFRADNAKAITSEGTGLGLYMTKSIADETGSKIWFESKLNQGTTFYISIPIENPVGPM